MGGRSTPHLVNELVNSGTGSEGIGVAEGIRSLEHRPNQVISGPGDLGVKVRKAHRLPGLPSPAF